MVDHRVHAAAAVVLEAAVREVFAAPYADAAVEAVGQPVFRVPTAALAFQAAGLLAPEVQDVDVER